MAISVTSQTPDVVAGQGHGLAVEANLVDFVEYAEWTQSAQTDVGTLFVRTEAQPACTESNAAEVIEDRVQSQERLLVAWRRWFKLKLLRGLIGPEKQDKKALQEGIKQRTTSGISRRGCVQAAHKEVVHQIN